MLMLNIQKVMPWHYSKVPGNGSRIGTKVKMTAIYFGQPQLAPIKLSTALSTLQKTTNNAIGSIANRITC